MKLEEEEGTLRHQSWHCEYLMVFMGTATDQSQKHCTPVTAKTHPWLKEGGPCLIKIQTGKHVSMEVLH